MEHYNDVKVLNCLFLIAFIDPLSLFVWSNELESMEIIDSKVMKG